nr:heterotrimeric guanine nucleotide-binding protein 3M1 [Echinops telfairi]
MQIPFAPSKPQTRQKGDSLIAGCIAPSSVFTLDVSSPFLLSENAGLGALQSGHPCIPPSDPCAAAMSCRPSVNALQRLVEQLKLEASMERIKVSQAAAALQQCCMQNTCKDAILVGVPAGSNPFREPRACALP